MNVHDKTPAVPDYEHTPLFPLAKDNTPLRKISSSGVRVEKVLGNDVLVVAQSALRELA
jgi:fumarate hydratase class I